MGSSLEELVATGRWQATPGALRRLAESLLEVLVHLASFAPPVVHRDIKPGNVLLESEEELKAREVSGMVWGPFGLSLSIV